MYFMCLFYPVAILQYHKCITSVHDNNVSRVFEVYCCDVSENLHMIQYKHKSLEEKSQFTKLNLHF